MASSRKRTPKARTAASHVSITTAPKKCRACGGKYYSFTLSFLRDYANERRIDAQLNEPDEWCERTMSYFYALNFAQMLGFCRQDCMEGEPAQGPVEEPGARARRREAAELEAHLQTLRGTTASAAEEAPAAVPLYWPTFSILIANDMTKSKRDRLEFLELERPRCLESIATICAKYRVGAIVREADGSQIGRVAEDGTWVLVPAAQP
jgi:hypothetical protein